MSSALSVLAETPPESPFEILPYLVLRACPARAQGLLCSLPRVLRRCPCRVSCSPPVPARLSRDMGQKVGEIEDLLVADRVQYIRHRSVIAAARIAFVGA